MLATPPEQPEQTDSPVRLKKVTVNLGQEAQQALTEIGQLTGRNQTDSINRALCAYLLITHTVHHGGAVYVRTTQEAELERIRPL